MDYENLKLPDDLKAMSKKEIEELAMDLREKLVDIVSGTGGHLASNLGVVELTIALYSIYDPYKDRIVWDVGHQTYVHKILTGRLSKMNTLRQKDGLSGFPKRDESVADAFNAGHSSTSISAALGIARGNQLSGNDARTVAIIGDGALSGGLAFEALNDAAQTKTKMTIVLNDNGMSISKNVGGLAKYLLKIRSREGYVKAKTGIRTTLEKIPGIGAPIARFLRKVKNSIKFKFTSGALFEDMGLTYIGPVNGHDVGALKSALLNAESHDGPSILHIITEKGKGYKPAEENPSKFHGIGPFDKETGEIKKCGNEGVSLSGVFAETLVKMAESDAKITAITAAMPVGTGLNIFKKAYPQRFFDVGIAEEHAVTMSAGMSAAGAKPVVAVYSTFMQRAYDEIQHDVALQELPLVVALDRAGVAGADGETHQGIFDFAYMYHMHGSTIIAPSSARELEKAIRFSMKVYDKDERDALGIKPSVISIRYPAKDMLSKEHAAIQKDDEITYSKGIKYIFEGKNAIKNKNATIISIGEMLEYAFSAAEILAGEGITVTLFDARFAKPLDSDGIVEACENADVIVTVEDGIKEGGFGVHAVEAIKLSKIGNKANNIIVKALPEEIIRQGKIREIHHKYGMDTDGIVESIREVLK